MVVVLKFVVFKELEEVGYCFLVMVEGLFVEVCCLWLYVI